MKKLFSLILFGFCGALLCGCATVEYQHIQDVTGAIQDVIIFDVDSDVSESTAMRIINDVYNDVYKYYIKPVENKRNEVRAEHMDSSISEGITLYREKNEDFRSVKVVTTCADERLFGILNTEILPKVYSNISADDEADTGYDVGLFIIKYIEKIANAFGDVSDYKLEYVETPEDNINITNKYSGKYAGGIYHPDGDGEYSVDDIKLRQMFVSPDTRLHSNANYVMEQGGYTYHLWELNTADPDQQLTFYYQTANTKGWYYLALAITFVIMITLIAMYLFRRKKVKVIKAVYGKNDEDQVKEFDIKDFDDSNKDF